MPIALKDNLCTRGVATTCSSRILDGWQPPYDATVVERLAATPDAIVIGKTNLDEFAMGSSTENSAFGPTRNPHDPDRVPGGSSGGSAAAVAAGFAPIALGSDTGGSIRQPAALCGVVGLKPTYGLVSRYGLVAFASSLDQIGPFATTVADAAALLDAIAGPDPRDSTSIPAAPPSYSAGLDDGVDGLRVGVITELMGDGHRSGRGRSGDRGRRSAGRGRGQGRRRQRAGHHATALSAYYLIAPAEASSNLARYDGVRYGLRVDAPTTDEMMTATRTAGFGAEVKRRIMLGTYALSAGYYDAYYGKALKVRTLLIADFAAAYERFDLLLAPDLAHDRVRLRRQERSAGHVPQRRVHDPEQPVGRPGRVGALRARDDDSMPVGVQVLAPSLREATMLQAAAVLEAAAPGSSSGKDAT